ncbi:MAG: YfhO family protein [Bacteroidetes bacterium]|nr:YfhO family protein [Bacteroidota bacterium]
MNYDSAATIQLTKYDANYLVYKSKCATDQLCVMSEIYYEKGWNAYVDGKLTPHWRCNFVLRSMIVPAGNHTIEFKFEPVIYKTGETISLASSSIMLLLFFGALIIPFFRKQKSA